MRRAIAAALAALAVLAAADDRVGGVSITKAPVVSGSLPAPGGPGLVMETDGTGTAAWQTMTGDVTLSSGCVATLASSIAGTHNYTGTLEAQGNGVLSTVASGTCSAGSAVTGIHPDAGPDCSAFVASSPWTFSSYFSTFSDVEVDSSGTNRPASTLQALNCTARQGNSGSDAGNDKFNLFDTATSNVIAQCLFVCNTPADTRTGADPRAFCQQVDGGPVQGVALPAGHGIRWAIAAGCSVTDTGGSCTASFTTP